MSSPTAMPSAAARPPATKAARSAEREAPLRGGAAAGEWARAMLMGVSKQTSVTVRHGERTPAGRAAYSPAMTHRTAAELEAGLDGRASPRRADEGVVRLIVRRPGRGQREVLDDR